MTSKLKGSEGVEFPDSTVQGSAAYTKAEANSQTWQNVTAQRAYGPTYTNSTGMAIKVYIQGITNIANATLELTVGTLIFRSSNQPSNGAWVIIGEVTVPAGKSYHISNSIGVTHNSWLELR